MYDYVIVGAGSAGCVLAHRLTEDPDVSVLLLEAGGPDTNDFVHMPAGSMALLRGPEDWDHQTAWEPHINDRHICLPRGKVLGGSSSLNWQAYMRGNRVDYDEWKSLGAHGWGWDDVLPYFLRAEDNERGASALHAVGGPLTVSDGRSRHVRAGMRCSAAVAYLHPAMQRPNLTVITDALCTRILFDGRRAAGVEIERATCCRSCAPSAR